MGGLAGRPSLFLRDYGAATFVPGGGDFPRFRALLWVDGGRVAGGLRLRDGYPTGGGGGPSARGDGHPRPTGGGGGPSGRGDGHPRPTGGGGGPSARGDGHPRPTGGGGGPSGRGDGHPSPTGGGGGGGGGSPSWAVGLLQEDGEAVEEVLCLAFGRGGCGVVGSPVLACYLCASPLFRHAAAFLCTCGESLVLGVLGDQPTGMDMTRSTENGKTSGAAPARAARGVGLVRVRGDPGTEDAKIAGGEGLVRVRGDRGSEDAKIARGGRGRDRDRGRGRGVPAAPGARRGPGRGTTPEGEGRRARRREALAAASYKPPPADEKESQAILTVQAPEGEGANQDTVSVRMYNEQLTDCYGNMVSVFRSVKKNIITRNNLRADADRNRDWSSLPGQLHSLRSEVDGLLSGYDTLCEAVDRLRCQIRADGGCPVEPPPLLAAHPRSLTSRK